MDDFDNPPADENPLDSSRRSSHIDQIKIKTKVSGIEQRAASTTLSDYKNNRTVTSDDRNKYKSKASKLVTHFEKNIIRKKIHSFWFNRQIPTFSNVLTVVNEDIYLPTFKRSSFQKVLNDLNFVYANKSRNSALLETNEIVVWRRSYLNKIRHYRQQNKPIYYLGETWIDLDITLSKSQVDQLCDKKLLEEDKRHIVFHIGSSDGFVPGALMHFESKTDISNCCDEINGDTFYEWFVKTVPLLKPNAVIVMDNASYRSMKKYPIPEMSWNKQHIIQWLENKGVVIDRPMVKAQLMETVKPLLPQYDKYVIDEFAKENNIVVLRLPPYHCELNPIGYAWSLVKHYVKINNTNFDINEALQLLTICVDQLSAEMWTSFIGNAMEEENKYWTFDLITDELLEKQPDHGVVKLETSDTSTDSD